MIRKDLSTTTDMELVFPDRTMTVPYSTFMGAIPDMTDPVVAQQVADAVREWIYTGAPNALDETLRLNKLPPDDSERLNDPATEGSFWRGTGGNAVLVSRPYIVSVAWDGERFQYGFRVPRVPE